MDPTFTAQLDILTYGIARIALAGVLGALIGFERSIHGRPAGVRTHFLVSLGAANFMLIAMSMLYLPRYEATTIDPGRAAAQIITGIGFIGAGVIIKDGLSVRGLTTASSLWVTASIGMATGAGYWLIACVATLLSLIALVFVQRLEQTYKTDSYRNVKIKVSMEVSPDDLTPYIETKDMAVLSYEIEKNYQEKTNWIRFNLCINHIKSTDRYATAMLERLEQSPFELQQLRWYKS